MKRLIFFGLFLAYVTGYGQQTINDTIMHDGLERSFILYVPASYSPGIPAPLVINLHGYTSNGFQQMIYGNFRSISDTAGFLLVHPNGTLDSTGQTYWNSNWGGTVDDIGFIEALIDSLASEYNLDLDRIYSTGMSNGGFMSYTLACELSNRIAAIASVTGSMNENQPASCNPQHPTPVMEIHGTSDATVPYNGIPGMLESIDDVIGYWISFDQCDTTPVITMMPDISPTDGCTAEHYLYKNGNNGVEVELYKIIDGGHTWPGAPLTIGVTNRDINASVKIWEFFAKYDINGRITSAGTLPIMDKPEVNVYPNPVNDYVRVTWNGGSAGSVRLLSLTGIEIRNVKLNENNSTTISLHDLSSGTYFLQLFNAQNSLISSDKIIKM